MGEQPKPVDDEVERALASMRAGFLSGSEQIGAHIALLDEHLVDAPSEEREAVHAQVTRLVASHDRITAKVMSAPASSWDTFKVMVSAVKQQQTVLDQISHLVQQHVLPRQLDNLTVTPFPVAAPPPEEEPPPPPRDDPFPPRHPFPADDTLRGDEGFRPGDGLRASDVFRPHGDSRAASGGRGDVGFPPGDSFRSEPMVAPRDRPDARRQPLARPTPRGRPDPGSRALAAAGLRARDEDDANEPERRSLLALVRERTAGFRGLAAMIVVGIILSTLPRERLQEFGTRLFDFAGPAGGEIAADDRPPTPPPAPVLPRSVERVPSIDDVDTASAGPEPATSAPSRPKKAASALSEKAPTVALAAPKQVVAPVAGADPVAPPGGDGEERFVPVVFTHKEHATVIRALSDLKQQYPAVLIGLEGEVQPVDLGKKGIWHRLVFLPAGPRPRAAKVCDQLAAQGYDRCWVKSY